MLQHKLIDEYAEKALPKRLPKKQVALLKDELICHILDKAEFYIEIGYDEETAIRRTLEEMGDAKEVYDGIKRVYRINPEIFLILSALFAFVAVIFYSLASVTLTDIYDFHFVFFTLLIGRAAIIFSILFALGTLLLFIKSQNEKKIRRAVLFVSVIVVSTFSLYGFLAAFDFYDLDNYFDTDILNHEIVQTFFPYNTLTEAQKEYCSLEIGENHLSDYFFADLYSSSANETDMPFDYHVKFYRTDSLFFKNKLVYETLYAEEFFFKYGYAPEVSSKQKLGSINYIFYSNDDSIGILICNTFDAFFIRIDNIEACTIVKESFIDTAIKQYTLIKKVFKDGTFDTLTLKEKFDYNFYF